MLSKMLSAALASLAAAAPAAQTPAVEALVRPVVIIVLCIAAGIGTVLLLPGRREVAFRKLGGIILLASGLILGAWLAKRASGSVHIYFWIFAFIALAGAVRVITHPRPVYSALYFVLTVFATAGLFVLLWAEFMAAALVLIYAGAILVTYVFVIMLAQQASVPGKPATALVEYDAVSREPIVAAAVGFTLAGLLLFIILDKAPATLRPLPETSARIIEHQNNNRWTQALGSHLFEQHIVNLELAGLLLTIAMVGAIIIARRRVVGPAMPAQPESLESPATPVDDNPHSIPVYGTDNPRQKAYPET